MNGFTIDVGLEISPVPLPVKEVVLIVSSAAWNPHYQWFADLPHANGILHQFF